MLRARLLVGLAMVSAIGAITPAAASAPTGFTCKVVAHQHIINPSQTFDSTNVGGFTIASENLGSSVVLDASAVCAAAPSPTQIAATGSVTVTGVVGQLFCSLVGDPSGFAPVLAQTALTPSGAAEAPAAAANSTQIFALTTSIIGGGIFSLVPPQAGSKLQPSLPPGNYRYACDVIASFDTVDPVTASRTSTQVSQSDEVRFSVQ